MRVVRRFLIVRFGRRRYRRLLECREERPAPVKVGNVIFLDEYRRRLEAAAAVPRPEGAA
ncbi:MAG TPA: hypothetical protein VIK99_06900 [Thermaerobacter sp.]